MNEEEKEREEFKRYRVLVKAFVDGPASHLKNSRVLLCIRKNVSGGEMKKSEGREENFGKPKRENSERKTVFVLINHHHLDFVDFSNFDQTENQYDARSFKKESYFFLECDNLKKKEPFNQVLSFYLFPNPPFPTHPHIYCWFIHHVT